MNKWERLKDMNEKKNLIIDNMINKVFCKIEKIIGIEKFDDMKILIDTDGKLSDEIVITLKDDMHYNR